MKSELETLLDIFVESGVDMPDKDQLLRMYSQNSEVWPIRKCGQMVGGVLFYGNTVHIAIKPEWQKKWATREMLRAYPTWTPAIDVMAPIRKTNHDSIRLAKHLGFSLSHDTDTHHIYVKRKYEHPA